MLLLAVLSACTGSRGAFSIFALLAFTFISAASATNEIRVQLTLNSGEEDPHWLITQAEQITHIQRSLQNLPPAGQPDWPTLGWRGFRLRGMTTNVLPGTVSVFKGTICILEGDKERCYHDQHKLEAWLHAEARRQGLEHLIPPSK
jgi:hypothetical protein